MSNTISVITVAYNAASTLAETLSSVSNQKGAQIEHIVVDGGSGDATQEVVQNYGSHVARFISEPDRGIYDAMNKGIALATGDIVGFLNADDMYADSQVLSDIVRLLDDSSIDACYSDLVYVARDNTKRIVRYWKSKPYTAGLFEKGWVPPHPTFYARRSVYQRFGAFNLKYKLAADFDLMARFLARHEVRSAYLPRVTVKMRLGGATNQTLANIVRQNIEIWQSAKENGAPIFVPGFLFRKVFARAKQFRAASRV